MSSFEKIEERECGRIELTDLEHLEKIRPKMISKITEIHTVPSQIPMNLNMPILEKEIKKGLSNEKSKSKIPKKKTPKNNHKSNKSAMARIQKEL